jgi:hypothetical protein
MVLQSLCGIVVKANLSKQEKKDEIKVKWMKRCSNNGQMWSGVVRGNKEKKKRENHQRWDGANKVPQLAIVQTWPLCKLVQAHEHPNGEVCKED